MYLFVKENYQRWWDEDAKPAGSRKAHKAVPYLRLSGPGSVFETLFLRGIGGADISLFLQVADDMISHKFHQCDVERAGRHMSLIKTDLRTRLGHQMYANLVFLSFNLPYLHEIDFDVLVAAWLAAGHHGAVFHDKRMRSEGQGRFLTNHYKRKSTSFLLKKGSAFLPTTASDLDFLRKLHQEHLELDRQKRPRKRQQTRHAEEERKQEGDEKGGNEEEDTSNGGGDDEQLPEHEQSGTEEDGIGDSDNNGTLNRSPEQEANEEDVGGDDGSADDGKQTDAPPLPSPCHPPPPPPPPTPPPPPRQTSSPPPPQTTTNTNTHLPPPYVRVAAESEQEEAAPLKGTVRVCNNHRGHYVCFMDEDGAKARYQIGTPKKGEVPYVYAFSDDEDFGAVGELVLKAVGDGKYRLIEDGDDRSSTPVSAEDGSRVAAALKALCENSATEFLCA